MLGIAGPLLLANLMRGRQNRGASSSMNPINMSRGGGLGSIISMLSGGRGFSGTGNMLNRLFRQ